MKATPTHRTPTNPLRRLQIAACWLALLAGCAGVGQHLEAPRINLANIQVVEVQGLETVFQVQLRVFNTNDTALQIKGADCELELNDRAFATGVSDAEVSVPSYGSALLPLTFYSSVIHVFRSIYGIQGGEQLNYRVKGRLRLAGEAFLPKTLAFESEGRLSGNLLEAGSP
jgi:LEA14-like dessication related protein